MVSALGRLKQDDCEFKAVLGYIASPHLKNKQQIRDRDMVQWQSMWFACNRPLVQPPGFFLPPPKKLE